MGAVETANRLQASCFVDSAGNLVNSNGVVNVDRVGLGDYEVTLEQEVAEAQAAINASIYQDTGFATYAQAASPVSNVILVQTFDGANPPVAADEAFTLNVWQLPRLETP